jgi:hypothetical protein
MVTTTLRLPKDLHERLGRIAFKHDRSLHRQMIHYLAESVRSELQSAGDGSSLDLETDHADAPTGPGQRANPQASASAT